jgi:hypothetical protein
MTTAKPAGGRDLYLDALRGLCLLSMIFLHLGRDTWAMRLSFSRTIGFFSGAEGFFFLSGMIFGRVYRRRTSEHGTRSALLVLRRVGRIYLYHLALLMGLVAGGALFPRELLTLSDTFLLAVDHPASALARGALFLYQPRFFDILPLYIVYLPLAWVLIWRRWDRGPALPIFALVLWAAQQFPATCFGATIFPGAFNFFSYLALFLAGLWLGGLDHAMPAEARRATATRALAAAVALGCFVVSHPRLLPISNRAVEAIVAFTVENRVKHRLGWLRVVNFFAVAVVVAWARPRIPREVQRVLASLGKRSLEVFAGHVGWFFLLCWPSVHLYSRTPKGYGAFLFAWAAAATLTLYLWDRRKTLGAATFAAPLPAPAAAGNGP